MEILNGLQAREYNRAQKLALFFSQQTKVYPLYPPFNDEAGLFSENNQRLISLVPAKDVRGISISIGKEALKAMVATLGNIICTRTGAYAIKTGNNDLKMAVYYRTAEIKRLKDADLLAFVTSLVATVSPLLGNDEFQKYAVTQDMLTSITNTAKDFNDCIGKAGLVTNTRNFASRTINDILKSIRKNISQLHLLLNFFDEKYPAFVAGFIKASAVDETGIRHSGIEGVIKNNATGTVIKEVTITGEGKNKFTKCDVDGNYRLIKLKTGTMTITVTAPGYDTQIIDVKILRGKVLTINFALQPLVVNQVISMATA